MRLNANRILLPDPGGEELGLLLLLHDLHLLLVQQPRLLERHVSYHVIIHEIRQHQILDFV